MFLDLNKDQFSYAGVLDNLKIVHHAHPVICPVSFIHSLDLSAGIQFTFKTTRGRSGAVQVCINARAFSEQIGTFFVTCSTAGALAFI
jgi:hypothetical protein